MSMDEPLVHRLAALTNTDSDDVGMERLERFQAALRRLHVDPQEAQRIDEIAAEVETSRSIAATTSAPVRVESVRDLIVEVSRSPNDVVDSEVIVTLREQHERLKRIGEQLESLEERTEQLQEEMERTPHWWGRRSIVTGVPAVIAALALLASALPTQGSLVVAVLLSVAVILIILIYGMLLLSATRQAYRSPAGFQVLRLLVGTLRVAGHHPQRGRNPRTTRR
jgi:hypothetical protein